MTPSPMKERRSRSLAFAPLSAIIFLAHGCATAPIPQRLANIQSQPIPSTPHDLARELAIMVEVDQQARFAMMENQPDRPPIALVLKTQSIDRANTDRMKRIVEKFGWPTISRFGKDTAHNAWLIVQHADRQPDFQRHCLDLMEPLLAKNEVRKDNYAYLKDRVLLAEGQKQIYGTQFHTVDGVFQPRPIKDPDDVDKRRKEMDMVSLKEYETWFKN